MSEQTETPETQEQSDATEAEPAVEPKDLPVGIVVAVVVVAVLIFGYIGWRRHVAMKEALEQQQPQAMQDAHRQGVEDAHRRAAEAKAAGSETSEPASQTQPAPP